MKNKHLLLIFACTLLLGVLAKYAPWFKSDFFQTDLIGIEKNALQRISIGIPGKSELALERSDEGWVASQDELAVRTPDSSVAAVLTALEHIRSIRIVHTKRPDSLWLDEKNAIHVELLRTDGHKEQFDIGREMATEGQAATFLKIDPHEGIYLVSNYLRKVFTKSIDDFRSKIVWSVPAEHFRAFTIYRMGCDTIHFVKNDTGAVWTVMPSRVQVPENVVEQWLNLLQQLNGLPFATTQEERAAEDAAEFKVELETPGAEGEIIGLQLFGLSVTTTADSTRAMRAGNKCLVYATQNSFNYFFLKDKALAQRIVDGPAIIAPD